MTEEAKIIRNSVQCLICNDEIVSEYRHDFQVCKCGNVFVDGGKDYLRRGSTNAQWRDTSVFSDSDKMSDTSTEKES